MMGGFWGLLPGLAILLACCAGPPGTAARVPVKALESGPHCGRAEPGISVIGDVSAWRGDDPATEVGAHTEPPSLDFARMVLVRVSMGRRSTAGYGLALAQERAELRDGTAVIRVRWRQPGPDAVQAQVVTRPCLLIRLPRQGIQRIRVIDEAGTLRGKAAVPQAE